MLAAPLLLSLRPIPLPVVIASSTVENCDPVDGSIDPVHRLAITRNALAVVIAPLHPDEGMFVPVSTSISAFLRSVLDA